MLDAVIKAIVPLVNALAGRDVVNAPGDISFPNLLIADLLGRSVGTQRTILIDASNTCAARSQ
jgi:hypothetical protein